MIIPVRCFTCNKVVGNKWKTFEKLRSENVSHEKIFKLLAINDMILISPESDRINIKLIKKLNKKFNLLNSSYDIHKLFSSKKKNL